METVAIAKPAKVAKVMGFGYNGTAWKCQALGKDDDMNKNTVIVCITIQLLFNACFLWYLADIRETTNYNHQRLSEVELSLIDIKYDTDNTPTPVCEPAPVVVSPLASSNDDWFEESQRKQQQQQQKQQLEQQKQQLDRIEQEQQRVKREQRLNSIGI